MDHHLVVKSSYFCPRDRVRISLRCDCLLESVARKWWAWKLIFSFSNTLRKIDIDRRISDRSSSSPGAISMIGMWNRRLPTCEYFSSERSSPAIWKVQNQAKFSSRFLFDSMRVALQEYFGTCISLAFVSHSFFYFRIDWIFSEIVLNHSISHSSWRIARISAIFNVGIS